MHKHKRKTGATLTGRLWKGAGYAKRTKYLVSGSIFASQVMISNLRPKTMLDRIEQIKTQEDCQEVYDELAPLIDGDQLSTLKKLQFCDLFFLKSMSLYSSEQFQKSPVLIFLKKRDQLTDTLVGLEKAQSYMDFAELIFTKNIASGNLVRKIGGEIRGSLDFEGQAIVDQWLGTEGERIKASLSKKR